jgi:hypothetical protein
MHGHQTSEDAVADTPEQSSYLRPFIARAIGLTQVAGGGFEAMLGFGMTAVPTGVTQVGGVILILHGGDAIVAGFRSLWTGEIQSTGTQQLGAAGASALGASPRTSQLVGTAVDLAAGVGPAIGVAVTQRVMRWEAERVGTTVILAYRPATTGLRGADPWGHNAVGVRLGDTYAFAHFQGLPTGMARELPESRLGEFALSEISVSLGRASAAEARRRVLVDARARETWNMFLGPNCTTTALDVLRRAGIVIPVWSRTPVLLQLGLHRGVDISIFSGTAGALAPPAGRAVGR